MQEVLLIIAARPTPACSGRLAPPLKPRAVVRLKIGGEVVGEEGWKRKEGARSLPLPQMRCSKLRLLES